MSRMVIAAACLATIMLTLGTGCSQNAAGEPKMVQIGTTKLDLFGIPPSYRRLKIRLDDELGAPIVFRNQPDGAAIGQLLHNGDIHFAIMTAAEYIQVENPDELQLLASAVNAKGATSLTANIIAKSGTSIKQLSDIKGKRFAFGTHGDLLTDYAARAALQDAGVAPSDLVKELLPPPFAFDGRLYRGADVVKTLLGDLTVNAGVIDEISYAVMPETGGNFITGPSKDQFVMLGVTKPVPERVVVAGPAADPVLCDKLRTFFLQEIKEDAEICKQMNVKAFAAPDKAAYDQARSLVPKGKDASPAA